MDNAAVKMEPVQDIFAAAAARHQAGELAEAVRLYRQALARQPDSAEIHFNLGMALKDSGQLPQAIAALQRAEQLRPDFVQAVSALGQALAEAGRMAAAVAAFEKAAALRPDLAETQNNLGNALCDVGQFGQAIGPLRQAIAINPQLAGAHSNLGNALLGLGETDAAAAAYRRAVELEPASVRFLNNLAVALRNQRLYDESIACSRRALELDAENPRAYDNLGSAWAFKGGLDEAEAAYRKGLSFSPDDLEIYCNLGHIFYFKGQLDKAQSVYRTILSRREDHAQAHWSLALILLTLGKYEEAWGHYEWRWRVKELHMRLRSEAPRWDGGDLNGRTVLVHNEQGFGDTIQFIRYLPEVCRRGGKIILACQRELFSLLKGFPGIDHCIANDEPTPPGSVDHQVCCPLLSLPGLLGTTAENIPADIPYLKADAEKARQWRQRLAGEERRKIGLAWAGRPNHPNDHNRSLNFSALAPLAEIPDARLINLQLGPAAGQAAESLLKLTDWTDELKDFSDTAGLIENLDLVITADTAIAHLAGAMGKRVWVLLPFIPDWRWMLKRTDSPWYPTMRLFRQRRIGDWATPIAQVAEALQRDSSDRGPI